MARGEWEEESNLSVMGRGAPSQGGWARRGGGEDRGVMPSEARGAGPSLALEVVGCGVPA